MAPVLATWRVDPFLIAALLLAAALYLRGWRRRHAARPERSAPLRALSFLASLSLLWLAIGSPLDDLAAHWLRAHMLQHLILMSVVPPLFWLGAPYWPLLVGLPGWLRKDVLGPLLAWPRVHALARALVHPAVAAPLLAVITWFWHVPAIYELALQSPFWHGVEHLLFLGGSLLLWFAVVAPPPASGERRGAAILGLVFTVLQTGALAALFVFSDRVLYPSYAAGPRLGGLSALEDQAAAGALLWLVDSSITVTAAMLATVAWLTPPLVRPASSSRASRGDRVWWRRLLPRSEGVRVAALRAPFDLLRVPVVGALLRRRGVRTALRAVLLGLAALIVWDGLCGPPHAYANAAGVLPWTHWRAFAVLALLAGGNFFCMACPFLLPRDLGRRLFSGERRWPRALRSKWVAVALVVLWLWTYEVLAPWDAPAFTAWLVLGYFAAALLVDGWFRGASFCKYVCPIGQFHFVQSLVSPLEVKVRDAAVCAGCRTHDCLRGRGAQRGCELELFLPTKVGNLDCTFCLDCADACPHGNVGVLFTSPGSALLDDRPRSSLGRLGERLDLAALALVLVFGAFASAAVMTGPGARAVASLAELLGASRAIATSCLLLAAVLPLPLAAVGGATWLWVRLGAALHGAGAIPGTPARTATPGASGTTFSTTFCRLALALVPVGAAMWAAHLLVHLAAGWTGFLPVFVRLAGEQGWSSAAPDWSLAHAAATGPWLRSVELVLLDAGLLLSLFVGWRLARSALRRPVPGWLSWALVALALWSFGAWLVFQPMEMRGTMVMP